MRINLNSKLFADFDEFEFIQHLTGQPMGGLGLDAKLEAAGLPYSVRDPIDVDTFNQVGDMVRAAFLAGYMVGRNPDLLFLAADDSGDGAE